jgi:phage shock protein A
LIAFQGEIARLKDEKVRMLARLANAKLRLGLRETLNGLSAEADIEALDAVRDHINRLVTEAQVHRDLGDRDLENRLANIRDAEAAASARAQLDELKRSRGRNLLPVVLRERAAS